MFSKFQYGMAVMLLGAMMVSSTVKASTPAEDFKQIRDKYVAQVMPLEKQANLAWWESATIGSDNSYAKREKADNAIAKLHQDKVVFAKLKELRQSKAITDPVMKRELEVMYTAFVPYQADPKLTEQIISREAEVDKIFNTHRSSVNGKMLTENDVRKVLSTTNNSEEARQAWQGYMAVGKQVAGPLKELVKLRNQVAQQLGYRDFFAMQLELQEFDEPELLAIFDDLDKLTKEPFANLKKQIDAHMAKRFALKNEPVRPWHLGDLFFQEAPELSETTEGNTFSLDDLYASKDPVKLSQTHYLSMGLNPDKIIARSDLYERQNKSPHAFETCMDRQQDIRVLCNVKPNGSWMDTVHHELGHGLYDQHINPDIPFLLRTPSHILTTEGMAMLSGELTRTHQFLDKVVKVPSGQLEEASAASWKLLRAERLIFSRWTQTMLHFEREMYNNPDQDLNKLWWDLKAKYQMQAPPSDMSGQDYGAKMHVVGAPVYYHNYMLGDLFASQVYTYAARNILKVKDPLSTSFYEKPQVGQYFKEKIYAPGNLYDWRQLVKQATGEPLGAKCFADLFVK